MSSNKLKYYTVITTSVVSAANMTDAESIARGKRGVQGSVMLTETEVDRVTASYAKTFTA